MKHSAIIQIDDILVSGDILTEYFCCDYPVCKGCCCIIGDSGAPLEECEIEALETNYEHFSDLMTEAGRDAVAEKGFFEVDIDGDIVTPLRGREECAYCTFGADGHCFCAIERRWEEGRGNFPKPISCSLYPIRVSTFKNGTLALNLHRWDICKDAFIKGRKEGIRVYQFLKNPIIRRFGEEFWEALDQVAPELQKEED